MEREIDLKKKKWNLYITKKAIKQINTLNKKLNDCVKKSM